MKFPAEWIDYFFLTLAQSGPPGSSGNSSPAGWSTGRRRPVVRHGPIPVARQLQQMCADRVQPVMTRKPAIGVQRAAADSSPAAGPCTMATAIA